MLRIAIVEDELKYSELLKSYIEQYESENQEKCQVDCFKDGMTFLEMYHSDYDLVCLDIEMPVLNGIEVAHDLRKVDKTVLIIFITNMAQYAIHGYEVDAFDYVVKPVGYYPFSIKLKRATRRIRERTGNSMLLPFEEEDKRVPIKDILYVEVHSHTVSYYTYYGIAFMTGTLKQIEEKLKDEYFVRCNSCYLVNLRHVTGIKDESVLVEGKPLKISRSKKKDFMKELSKFYASAYH